MWNKEFSSNLGVTYYNVDYTICRRTYVLNKCLFCLIKNSSYLFLVYIYDISHFLFINEYTT